MENSMNSVVSKLVSWFEEAEDASYSSRLNAERDRDYWCGNQLTSEEIAELKRRGQPRVVINRIRRKIEWYSGLEKKSRVDPKAFPRRPNAEQGAEAATDALRFVADATKFDQKRSRVFGNMLVEGYGGAEVVHEVNARGDVDIKINRYSWDRLFHDPRSSEDDFSDARYLGAVIWSDAEEVAAKYPHAREDINESVASISVSDTYDDKPKTHLWADSKTKRIRVVLIYWHQQGVWYWAKYTKGALLEGGQSPYVNEHGETVCPLRLVSTYVDRDNNRHGVVRDMVDPQDEINKRRSKSLHLLNSRQTIGEEGAVSSVAAMKREMAKADGHVVVTPDMRFDVLPNADLAAGQAALLNEAKQEIDMMGANSALSGDTGSSTSGRAVLARQQGGMIEIASIMDNLHQWTQEIYEHIWMRVRQFWTEEKWIRVTDDERNVRFVGLNRPVTLGEVFSSLPPEAQQQMAFDLRLQPNDPRFAAVVKVENPVEEIDVDIVIESVPDQVTLAGETFEQLVNLARTERGIIPSEILIEAAPGLRRDMRDKLLRRMEEEAQSARPVQGAMVEADIREKNAKAMKDEAEAASKMPLAAYG